MMRLYSVYDRVAEEFNPPWPANNDAVALRQFQAFKEKMSAIAENDLMLYCLCVWDSSCGITERFDVPREVSKFEMSAITDLTDIKRG